MNPEQIFPTLLALWVLYWILRLVIFELLTITLRRITPAKSWFRKQAATRLFDRNLRSSEIFSDAINLLGRATEWITGRGWIRAPTFVFVAAVLIFLSVLPIDHVQVARAQYDSNIRMMQDADPLEVALGACLLENALAEASRRTGLSFAPPAGFKIYPIDNDTEAKLDSLRGDRLLFMTFALMNGRTLTDDPAKVDPLFRKFPRLERALNAQIVDGRLTKEGYRFLPPDPASEAARNDLVALCDGDPKTHSQKLVPVRDPEAYLGLVERLRTRYLAFLNDSAVREAFRTYQVQSAASRFSISFFFSVATAVILWMSLKLMTGACRTPRHSIWLIINYVLVLILSACGAVGTTFALLGAKETVNAIVPFASGYLVATAADPTAEAEYQRQTNAFIGKGIGLVEATCVDVGSPSPLTGWCETAALFVEPWDPDAKRFDFERLLPPDDGTNAAQTHLMRRLARSPMTFAIAYSGVDEETQDRFDVSIWQGVRMGSFVLVVIGPWLLLFALATLLVPLLELRWTVVKRVDRIVRERSRPK